MENLEVEIPHGKSGQRTQHTRHVSNEAILEMGLPTTFVKKYLFFGSLNYPFSLLIIVESLD